MKINKFKLFKVRKFIIFNLFILFTISCSEKNACGYDDDNIDTTFPYSCNSGMDVAFLIDYTSSMSGAIDNIKTSIGTIIPVINTQSGGNYRLSLSIFDEQMKSGDAAYSSQPAYTSLPANQKKIITTGATTNQYLTVMEKFSVGNNTSFTTQLNKLNSSSMAMGNGAGFAEPGGLLINEVLNNNFVGAFRTTNITKLLIIITDAPAGGDDDLNDATDDAYLVNLANTANTMGVQCILITSLSTSNYETELIDNNTDSMKEMNADFSHLSDAIIRKIEDICNQNDAN